MIEWRQVVQSYACESCGAAPGSPCITIRNVNKAEPHASRTRQAAENGWNEAEQIIELPPRVFTNEPTLAPKPNQKDDDNE